MYLLELYKIWYKFVKWKRVIVTSSAILPSLILTLLTIQSSHYIPTTIFLSNLKPTLGHTIQIIELLNMN